jgi:transcriptional regulator with XRE-family HTH domain
MTDKRAVTDEARGGNLAKIRKEFDATQAEMAMMMDLPFRTYQDIEAGKVAFRGVHGRAFEMALLRMAAVNDKADKLAPDLKRLVKDLAEKLR